MDTNSAFSRILGKVEAMLNEMRGELTETRWFYDAGNMEGAYARAMKLEETSEKAVLLTRALGVYGKSGRYAGNMRCDLSTQMIQ